MIYIIKLENEDIVIEAPEGLDFQKLYAEYKEKWLEGLSYTPNEYTRLCKTIDYKTAYEYLDTYRKQYDAKVMVTGTPVQAWIKSLEYDRLIVQVIDLEDEDVRQAKI